MGDPDLWRKYFNLSRELVRSATSDDEEINNVLLCEIEKFEMRLARKKDGSSSSVTGNSSVTTSSGNEETTFDSTESEFISSPIRKKKKLSFKVGSTKIKQSEVWKYIRSKARYYPGQKLDLNVILKSNVKQSMIPSIKMHLKRIKSKIETALIKRLGGTKKVKVVTVNGKRRYTLTCPNCGFRTRSLESHLVNYHKYPKLKAKAHVSWVTKTFLHLTLIVKQRSYHPDICLKCSRHVSRIDKHLVEFHKMKRGSESYDEFLRTCKSQRHENHYLEKPGESSKTAKPIYKYSELSVQKKRELDICKEDFRYFYENHVNLLEDLERYLQDSCSKARKDALQIISAIRLVWSSIDEEMTVNPNSLKLPERLEDDFFNPRLKVIIEQDKLEKENQSPHLKATTMQTKLSAVLELINFSKLRYAYIGLKNREMELLELKIRQLCQRLKPHKRRREQKMADWKSECLITPVDLLNYGKSVHVQAMIQTLDDLQAESTQKKVEKMKMNTLTGIRNYLMVTLSVINAARASNLINIKVADVETAKYDEEFEAYIFKSSLYKTSIVYGSKIMVVPRDLYRTLKTYIRVIHPILSGEQCRWLFTSCRKNQDMASQMEHPVISNSMTKSFELASIFARSRRVSPSHLRCAVVTDLVGVSGEDCESVAQHLMKHSPKTSRRFYIQRWAQVESIRLSMKCYSRFIECENLEKIECERKTLMERERPTKTQILQWLSEAGVEDERLKTFIEEGDFADAGNTTLEDLSEEKQDGEITDMQTMGDSTVSLQGECGDANESTVDYAKENQASVVDEICFEIESKEENGVAEIEDNDGSNEFKPDDWYICRPSSSKVLHFSRKEILVITLVAQDVIRNDWSINRGLFMNSLEEVQRIGYDIGELKTKKWEKIKDVIKNMKNKYKIESSHQKFDEFVLAAQCMLK